MTPDESRDAVYATARRQGLDPRGATLLQGGPHHTWRLPKSGAIARVWRPGTSFEEALRANRIALWLLRNGIAAARPVGRSACPVQYEGRYLLQVTVAVDLGDERPTPAQLGAVLRELHGLEVPAQLGLPTFSPFPVLARRIKSLPPDVLSPQQRSRVRALLAGAREAWRATDWPERCVMHGDPGRGNCITTPEGVALIDFERTSVGHRWRDQASAAWRRDVFGAGPDEYEEFAEAYGADVTALDGGRIYREVLTPEFAVNAWLNWAEYAQAEPELQPEADRRLATITTDPVLPPFPWGWAPNSAAAKQPEPAACAAAPAPAPGSAS
ncbi:aminoglycoside phosphotransferase family protein [Streptomyces sp. MJM8645]|uniref:phosphotransferase family protein n=1 Tax=Streptomycetaceae TaxID=2062 RepID=UPI0007AFBAD1|nr:aminoglycoside phosphotransferase family protein [Streptomyces sp. MJM8645]